MLGPRVRLPEREPEQLMSLRPIVIRQGVEATGEVRFSERHSPPQSCCREGWNLSIPTRGISIGLQIAANWADAGITPDKRIAFYCGTGWRASETWFYAYLVGWDRIAVYDGGWFEWSQDPVNNPIEAGEPSDEAAA
jgi:rhodanese-related sulfurtransferase